MKNIVTLGLGKVGTLVGVLLSKKYNVNGIDKQQTHYSPQGQMKSFKSASLSLNVDQQL